MRILLLSAIFALSACNSTINKPASRTAETNLSAVQPMPIEVAQERGVELYTKDRYGALATDFLLSKGLLNKQSGVKGWITDIDNNVATTYFIGDDVGGHKVIFNVTFTDGVAQLIEPSSITKTLADKFSVRQLSLQAIQAPCSDAYNTVVIEDSDKYVVYALAATSKNHKIVIGGHYRFSYAKQDLALLSKERLSKSCIMLDNTKDSIPFITHIVTDTPLDVHAYLSLAQGHFYISTKSGLYHAQNGKFEFLQK